MKWDTDDLLVVMHKFLKRRVWVLARIFSGFVCFSDASTCHPPSLGAPGPSACCCMGGAVRRVAICSGTEE